MYCRCNPDADLRRLERIWETSQDAADLRAYWSALRRVYPEFLAESDYRRVEGKSAFELTAHARIKWRNQHSSMFVYPDGSWLKTNRTNNSITWGYQKHSWASRIMFPRPNTTFFGLRNNPDEDIRRLERIFQQDPTPENRNRLNDARMRAGLSLILDIPESWREWAHDHPPKMAISIPEAPYFEGDNYIEAENVADAIEVTEGEADNTLTCEVLFHNHIFYVVPKYCTQSWLCSKCRARMVSAEGCWLCKKCGWACG